MPEKDLRPLPPEAHENAAYIGPCMGHRLPGRDWLEGHHPGHAWIGQLGLASITSDRKEFPNEDAAKEYYGKQTSRVVATNLPVFAGNSCMTLKVA